MLLNNKNPRSGKGGVRVLPERFFIFTSFPLRERLRVGALAGMGERSSGMRWRGRLIRIHRTDAGSIVLDRDADGHGDVQTVVLVVNEDDGALHGLILVA